MLADTRIELAEEVAASIDGPAVSCDVTQEQDIINLVAQAESKYGPIDLFCSNAGLCIDEPDHAASASNEVWQLCWDIHVMAHVYAARAVLPSMISRKSGYLLNMCSAAGLLSLIGNAAYSATKAAAIGFAESVAITHGEQGIKVSVICPQYVATPLLGYTDSTVENLPDSTITTDVVAEAVVEGVRRESFLILPHPDVSKYISFKSADYDKWLATMQTLRTNATLALGTTNLRDIHKLG